MDIGEVCFSFYLQKGHQNLLPKTLRSIYFGWKWNNFHVFANLTIYKVLNSSSYFSFSSWRKYCLDTMELVLVLVGTLIL